MTMCRDQTVSEEPKQISKTMTTPPKPARRSRRPVEVAEIEVDKTRLVDDEEEADAAQNILSSPRARLAIILLFVVVSIATVCAVRPFERVIAVVLPDFYHNETGNSLMQQQQQSESNPRSTGSATAAASRERFFFRQCHPNATNCCNGLENTCDLRINEVMFATLHNAMTAKEDGALLRPNHLYSLESALEAGFRGIHLEVCNCNGVYQFCHGICNLGARNPTEVFLNMDRFLRDNRQEVLLVTLQINNEVFQKVDLMEFYNVMTNATRFSRYLYVRPEDDPTDDEWPTLQKMIESNKRILLFHNNGPSCANATCPRGMHYWPDHAFETEVLEVGAQVDDIKNSCRIAHHPRHESSSSEPPPSHSGSNRATFLGVNHFLALPNAAISQELNEFDFVSERMEACSKINGGMMVNLVSSDFWHLGNIVEFVQRQNKARTPTR